MPLNPFANWAGKRSQVSVAIAWLDRRELHRRPARRILGTLFCASSMRTASGRRSKFTVNPTRRFRFEGIRCNNAGLNLIASGAFKQSLFKTDWPRRNAFQHHPRLAAGTTRPFDSGQELWNRGHGASLRWGGSVTGLSVTDGCRWRAVIEPLCAGVPRQGGQY